MVIDYRINTPLLAADVSELFKSSGINRPADDLARIQKMIDNADLTVTAWEGDKLVGIARALTDYSYCCYLSDLAVSGEYQKSGIGKELVNRLREHLGDEVTLLLIAAPSAVDYYPRIGFERNDRAYVIPRAQ